MSTQAYFVHCKVYVYIARLLVCLLCGLAVWPSWLGQSTTETLDPGGSSSWLGTGPSALAGCFTNASSTGTPARGNSGDQKSLLPAGRK